MSLLAAALFLICPPPPLRARGAGGAPHARPEIWRGFNFTGGAYPRRVGHSTGAAAAGTGASAGGLSMRPFSKRTRC